VASDVASVGDLLSKGTNSLLLFSWIKKEGPLLSIGSAIVLKSSNPVFPFSGADFCVIRVDFKVYLLNTQFSGQVAHFLLYRVSVLQPGIPSHDLALCLHLNRDTESFSRGWNAILVRFSP
jgi:hypothetical protein